MQLMVDLVVLKDHAAAVCYLCTGKSYTIPVDATAGPAYCVMSAVATWLGRRPFEVAD